jgi:group II intron reverse transcriptase/maturase
MVLTNLAHHIDEAFLHEAYRRTRKDGATGIDGQTADEYAADLEGNLRRLLARMRDGSYRAPPVRRVHIPKPGSTQTRPIGIPTFEDKVLQRAVAMVLEAVYEQEFLDCSYGFRPGRSAHQALESLWTALMKMRGGWVLEVDIQNFFEDLDHGQLGLILDRRMRDFGLRRLIGKWLNAGVMEGGALARRATGTPQGGVISPLLANLYLHDVLDVWFEGEVKPRLRGTAHLVRYADDFVIAFEREEDACRVQEVLPKRLAKYGLRVHPDKTRLVPFRRPPREGRGGDPRPGTFALLGFTHYWGRSQKGAWIVRTRTSKDRLRRSLLKIAQWCRRNRHLPIREQHAALSRKVRGHYAYFGVTGNFRALACFVEQARRLWRKWLSRRSYRANRPWDWMNLVLRRYPLPAPTIVHLAPARSQPPT